jgi:4-amino-4-deoxy-L-arabinose transferase-like glycosyltransferase
MKLPFTKSAIKGGGTNGARSLYICLTVILVMATALRLYWMVTKTPVISLEGSEYVRMADNLAQGQGLKGNFDGPETMYAPLYAVVTAGVELVVKDAELAAHLVSLACGILVIIPVFFIAYRIYGTRVAYIAAALIAFNPLFIALSGSIYNENIYLLCLLTGLYFGLRAFRHHHSRYVVMLALFITLAYLSRPEASAYIVFFIAACWIEYLVGDRSAREAVVYSVIIASVFAAVASPYIYFLYKHKSAWKESGISTIRLRIE